MYGSLGTASLEPDEGPAEEAADVFIVLAALIVRGSINIEDQVQRKMLVNLNRHWELKENGKYDRQR